MFAFCLSSVINNWLLEINLVCIMNAWTTFCGRIVRNSVWTPNAVLPRWSAKMIWSVFHFLALWNPLLPSINQSSSDCGLFTISSFLVHPNCAQILKSCLYFQNRTSSLFFFPYLIFAGLTHLVHSSVSEIYFWLPWQTNMLIIFLSPKMLCNTLAIIV